MGIRRGNRSVQGIHEGKGGKKNGENKKPGTRKKETPKRTKKRKRKEKKELYGGGCLISLKG